jgi:H+/Cl- antiporter ClcA
MKGQESYLKHVGRNAAFSVKWICIALLVGSVTGLCASVFAKAIGFATSLRLSHPWILYAMPAAGILIVSLYRLADERTSRGTNMVIDAIRSDDEEPPLRMAPLIFIATVMTHLTGGSAGREGAALQLGGSLGNGIGHLLRLPAKDRTRSMMIGMSAAFSALFGTPLAASVMPTEISTVGIIYDSALVPCVIAALTANVIAGKMGLESEAVRLRIVETFGIRTVFLTLILAILCAAVGILFCVVMHQTGHVMKKRLKNEYVRVIVGSVMIILLTLLVGDQTYNGTGSAIIELCKTGNATAENVKSYAFLLKILFTAITLSCGYKGGEIVPTFFVGATFGCMVGPLMGLDPGFAAAVALAAPFCGNTNCPIAATFLAMELFGGQGMPLFIVACSVSYMLSGKYSLYNAQRISFESEKLGKVVLPRPDRRRNS